MRIVALSENTAVSDKLFAEHGLCLYIEHNDKKILFGSGASALFVENAKRLDISVDNIDALVLPHNHTSVSGGTEVLIKRNPAVTVFLRKDYATDCAEQKGIFRSRTGLPSSFFKANKLKCVLFTAFSEVCKDFYIVTAKHYEKAHSNDKTYLKKRGRKWAKDDFSGETFAVCFPGRRKDGFVILTGCSHSGITNIVKTAREMWDAPVIAVIGGFNMMGGNINRISCGADEIKHTATELQKLDIGYIYTCHCTGRKGYEMLKETLGDQIQYLHTGEELKF
ncbi:MAG: MBL fold metallo-hydrolase [Ruminococcaceae bacterium]|nr:MBL fold metallo-hydrolase [Oscillospiraceae bacterium]